MSAAECRPETNWAVRLGHELRGAKNRSNRKLVPVKLTALKLLTVVTFIACCVSAAAAELPKWAPFVEPNFPFYSSVLDARKAAHDAPTNNLTPRGLILNLGDDIRVCFDIDMLRVAAVWRGPGVTPVSMSQGSYENENWGKKAPEGQGLLPKIVGEPLMLNDLLSGIDAKEDPRPPGPDPTEIGRGPLPTEIGEFKAINFGRKGVSIDYRLKGEDFSDHFGDTNSIGAPASQSFPVSNIRFWPGDVQTKVVRISTNDAYRIEHIALPIDNPWRRNVRIADIAFFSDARAAVVTFDGDIWLVNGLSGGLNEVQWRRFTSGLHEPLSLVIRNDEIFVFDRNGIWKILDTDKNGEADRHEMFCNRFTQTAETREFASSMKLLPDGGFVIAKPGQTGSTVGRDSGKVLKISADGKTVTSIGHGFRQPFLGVHPRTGLVTASDQQGNYIPTTPLHVVRDDQYYGFRPVILPLEKETPKIAAPLVWIPHAINASGACQLWLDDNMGPLSNTLLHIAYYRAELFNVLWDGVPNAAVVSFTRDLQFQALSGAIHPKDKSVFITGFQLWGGAAPEISGLARITYLAAPTAIPRAVTPMHEGVLISFHQPIATASVRPENFSAERWNYRRSHEYGSPHFKLDGSKGQETLFASSAYLSDDRKSVFVGIPDMRPVMQFRFGWSLAAENGLTLQRNAYLTPRDLQHFEPAKHGFQNFKVDLTPRTNNIATDSTPITAAEGKRLAELMGCVACHSSDGSSLGKVGPTWKGLAGARVRFTDGTTAVADAEYLRESIQKPAAKVVKDFDKSDAGMPSYEGILNDAQIDALILYIESLR
jgi:mono/diheme cytochrome c family protein